MAVAEEVRLPQELSRGEKVWRWTYMNVPSFIAIFAVWEFIARFLAADPALFPTVDKILYRAWQLSSSGYEIHLPGLGAFEIGVIFVHTFHTAWRILLGISIAIAVGVPIGISMGRFRLCENFWVPIVAVLLPIPALAWSPVLVLWFGLGNTTMIFITSFAAALPVMSNTWTGVKTVNEVWVRAAQSMDARGFSLFRKVILPGSLPFILSGIRIGLARAWRAGVAGEMVAASYWGLGYAIFDSREYLDTAFMLVGIAVIGIVGFIMEKFIFQKIELATVIKWGMMEEVAGEGRR